MEELGTSVSHISAENGDAALQQPLKPLPGAYSPWLFKAGLTPEQVEAVPSRVHGMCHASACVMKAMQHVHADLGREPGYSGYSRYSEEAAACCALGC